ncbi:isopentenyl-diphosphate Delta-isomerase [Corynebacterium sp. 4HC-13]|uniref:Isopentenyl-diphosphate Delta-isomerase n=2 Tax=Corynebacterium anserum TaxID=2684406 RepID=A0A7G7YRA6_9CORY|nr:isopentenyl-diphosphate Delta-isomerase [Corynebacterium anserum]QNH97026.1 isopentenyl-diphosphate Delta-isomerase [Corynebacterium anserum]
MIGETTASTNERDELVILVDDAGNHIGQALKSEVHSRHTPLHLAFSSYILNERRELLVTRRALEKSAWPGVWTNSVCGHPAPGETTADAVVRRAQQELGMRVEVLTEALPDFRYRAVDVTGVVEWEICPVFIARAVSDPRPNSDEVCDYRWVALSDLFSSIDATPFAFSPWMVEQLSDPRLRSALRG